MMPPNPILKCTHINMFELFDRILIYFNFCGQVEGATPDMWYPLGSTGRCRSLFFYPRNTAHWV